MNHFIYFYQHIPYYLNPIVFSIGNFSLGWYSLMYLIGLGIAYALLKYRLKKGELDIKNKQKIIKNSLEYLLIWIFAGLVIGGRIGYVLFYNPAYYRLHPLAIISPFDSLTHQFIGIYGMSYHGGLIGGLMAGWMWTRSKKINFWSLANFIIPVVPAAYFFGRLGNFINGELYGRVTHSWWGMYFPADFSGQLRYPSQLYEAFLEGFLLFFLLWKGRNKEKIKNKMFGLYIVGYALMRIIAEFFRQPDAQIGYIGSYFTLGQLLSFIMLIAGCLLIFKFGQKTNKMV